MTELAQLDVWDNRLTGILPSELALLTKLQGLGLQCNRFVGSLPPLNPLTQLEFLSTDVRWFDAPFAGCMLSEEIPPVVTGSIRLTGGGG